MFVLGIQGSPRKKGNTDILLSAFMESAQLCGVETQVINVYQEKIAPCIECSICEKNGICSINDEMQNEIYPLIRRADLVVLASPIFFYNVTAPTKALIDRTQTFWSRKYRLKMDDPRRKIRKGFLMAIGATKGKNLFNGTLATTKYFFDAIGATSVGELTYKQIEFPGDIKNHDTAIADATQKAQDILSPFMQRKKILFACRENACRSQMAAAFAHHHGGELLEAVCGGSTPAKEVNANMIQVMQEIGIDMGYIKPQSIERSIQFVQPDIIVTMGCGEDGCPFVPGSRRIDWDLEDPAGQSLDFMRQVRDDIQKRVLALIETLKQ